MSNQPKVFIIVVIFLTLLTAACDSQPALGRDVETIGDETTLAAIEALTPVELAERERLQVVATTNIVGDLVGNVAGDKIELTTMLPPGSDPHTFTPAPQDVTTVADADVVFVNGLGLEGFLTDLIENAGGEAPVVALATGIETIDFGTTDEHDDEPDEHQAEPDHDHARGDDPHIWLTPHNAMTMVHNVEAALSALDPGNAATYATNAAAYQSELTALDAWVMAQIAAIPEKNREMVTDHDAFGYYADRYGLEIVGAVIPNYSTNAEPSAQELAALQDAVSKYNVPAIFVGTTVNPLVAKQLAADSGIDLVPLYTGSLGEAGSGAETYLDLIRYDTEAIVRALRPKP